MSLTLNVYVKRKVIDGKAKILDKRSFKYIKTNRERLIDNLKSQLDNVGITNKEEVVRDLIKIKNFQNLNFPLLITVYLYLRDRDFDFGIVTQNFDNDFKEQVKYIKENGIFDLDKKGVLYNFRQDFILYMLLILNTEEDEYEEEYQLQSDDEEFEENREEEIQYDIKESTRDEAEYQDQLEREDDFYRNLYY